MKYFSAVTLLAAASANAFVPADLSDRFREFFVQTEDQSPASPLFRDPVKHREFDRWEMEGVYYIHTHRRESHQGHRDAWFVEDAGEDEPAATTGSDLWWFRKIYDSEKKMARIDAYPISTPIFENSGGEGHHGGQHKSHRYKRPQGPFVMLVCPEGAYLLEEGVEQGRGKREEEEDVECRHLPEFKFRQFNPLKEAHFEKLTFEENQLTHKYTGKNLESMRNTKVNHFEIYLDAFTDEPVNLFAEGYCSSHAGRDVEELSGQEGVVDFTIQGRRR